ncbi:MAG TPA: glycoside hydrolase family 18 protein [Rhodanobacteraceae bacterium]|jgi:chitinase|nr:glycoside hydrolase family 18 protein [Rhodanobacteraceae bacterium]
MPCSTNAEIAHRPSCRAALAALLATAMLLVGGWACADNAPAQYRVIGYATGWNPAQDKDVDKIDTLIFAFAKVQAGRVMLADVAARKLRSLVALKARDPALKVDISVGGWGAGGFSEAARTPAGRKAFAESAARLVVDHGADGLDIDWEYPGHHESGIASSPDDRDNFTLLLKAVRAGLDAAGAAHGRHYTLSIAVADGPFASGVDIAAVNRYVDWFNLMTYDFCNSMTPDTCHHTGLHASQFAPADARTTDRAVGQFLAAGVPPRKLVIGAAFYGREFGDVNPAHDGLYRPYKKYVDEIPWPKLKAGFIGKHGFVRHWDAKADAPWLWNTSTRTFITYDDPESIAAKAAFVKAHHLGGVMYWEQSLDPNGELLDAIWRGLQ